MAEQNPDQALVTAAELERLGVLKKGTCYRMLAAGKLPHYLCGVKSGGVRFRVDEVLSALRRPARVEVALGALGKSA